jgi:hypothetical protein
MEPWWHTTAREGFALQDEAEWIGDHALVRLAAPALNDRSHEFTNNQRERE